MVICVFTQFLDCPVYNYIVVQCGMFGCVGKLFVEALGFIRDCGGMEFIELMEICVFALVCCC